ncbi:MAG TPA: nitroreductase family protein [Acidimicrobiales bacterium]|nr:nitroreductase family protein [Acidimicrobiales bacterium]
MEFQDVLRKRRMVRSFLDKPVPPGTVDRILRNATRAPSAGFSQGWAFLALEGPDQTKVFWDLCMEGMAPEDGGPPVLILPMANKSAYLERYSRPDKLSADMQDEASWPAPYWDIDVGMASMNILLTCVDEGLGALFFGFVAGEDELKEHLGVPPQFRPIGAIAIGWPSPTEKPSGSPTSVERRPKAETIHYGRWGASR